MWIWNGLHVQSRDIRYRGFGYSRDLARGVRQSLRQPNGNAVLEYHSTIDRRRCCNRCHYDFVAVRTVRGRHARRAPHAATRLASLPPARLAGARRPPAQALADRIEAATLAAFCMKEIA